MSFHRTLTAHSMAMVGKSDLEYGGKILLPASALEILAHMEVTYPMIFRLFNASAKKVSHAGVWEFTAEEGHVYMPYWLLQNLMLQEGQKVTVTTAKLPRATFAKFQPQSTDFLDISNPKAVLENSLGRKFSALSQGDTIRINYNQKNYDLSVLELKPAEHVSIYETDMDVDFAPPIGYVDPSIAKAKEGAGAGSASGSGGRGGQLTFGGGGREGDGNGSGATDKEKGGKGEGEGEGDGSNIHYGYVPFSGTGNALKPKKGASTGASSDRSKPQSSLSFGGPKQEKRKGNGKDEKEEEDDKWGKLGQGYSLR